MSRIFEGGLTPPAARTPSEFGDTGSMALITIIPHGYGVFARREEGNSCSSTRINTHQLASTRINMLHMLIITHACCHHRHYHEDQHACMR